MHNRPKIEFSFDDGYSLDLKVARILERNGFSGTFFIPTNCELSDDEIVKLSKEHLIGGHTVTHPMDLKLLADDVLVEELHDNRWWLRNLTGTEVNHFCYPRGRYDERVQEAVRKVGYTSARTTQVGCFDTPFKFFEKGTTVHMYNRTEYNGLTWQEYALWAFDKALQKGASGYFHMWGHTKTEIDKNEWWVDFERILVHINETLLAQQ